MHDQNEFDSVKSDHQFLYALAIALALTLFGIDALHSPVEVGLIYAFTTYVQGFFNPMSQMIGLFEHLYRWNGCR